MITANSYFSGIGMLDLGLQRAGISINQAFELDSDACKTYRANHKHGLIEGDLTQQLVMEQDSCDIMAFTYPCTKYSRIADIHGTRTGDELFLHALRHLAIARPEAYLVENVPGMRAFPVVMEAMTKMPDYYIQTFCPVKTETWLPQRRHRLIIVGTKKRFTMRPPEGTRAITLSEVLEQDPEIKIPKALETRMQGGYRDLPIVSDPAKGDIAPTCVAHYHKDRSTRAVVDKRSPIGVRPYTVREWARLQGIPDNFTFPVSNNLAYKQIGNGVPVDMAYWAGKELIRYFSKKAVI